MTTTKAKDALKQGTEFHKAREAYFVKYQRLDRPVTDPGALPLSLKRITKALYREEHVRRTKAEEMWAKAEQKVKRLELMLQNALKAGAGIPETTGNHATWTRTVAQYMGMVTEGSESLSIDQTSVTLDQWGDLVDIRDANARARKDALAKKLLSKAKAKNRKAKR